jgi:hypothetical protein
VPRYYSLEEVERLRRVVEEVVRVVGELLVEEASVGLKYSGILGDTWPP